MVEHVLMMLTTYSPATAHQDLQAVFVRLTSMIVQVCLAQMVQIAKMKWQITVVAVGRDSLVEIVK